MALWTVTRVGEAIRFGSVARKAVDERGCNQPFKSRFWCPRKGWFGKEPCPFANRYECMSFTRFAGAI